MKVRHVELFPLVSQRPNYPIGEPIPEYYGWWEGDQTVVRIDTDEGISGWGSCGIRGDLAKGSLDVYLPHLIGENAMEPERVSDKLEQVSCWYGRGGVLTAFISAIDIALWDITGHALKQPVARLLGGIRRDRIKPYASQLFWWPVDKMVKNLTDAKAQGFRAFKLGWGPFGRKDARMDEAMVKAARQAVGDDCDLMIDAGGSEAYWHGSLKWAMETAKMLKEYNVVWFEEALRPDDLWNFKTLRENSPVPIATGECLRRRQTFYPWIFQHAVDILQPDVTVDGGITDTRRIAWLANDESILVVLHGWNTALGVAADLQLTAAFEQAKFVEYETHTPYTDGILSEPFKLDKDGMMTVPMTPGLGVTPDVKALKRLGPK